MKDIDNIIIKRSLFEKLVYFVLTMIVLVIIFGILLRALEVPLGFFMVCVDIFEITFIAGMIGVIFIHFYDEWKNRD